jgi:SAM-dependent methyltransferase
MKVVSRILRIAGRLFPRPFLIRMSYFFSWFTRFLFKGNNVECPVCEKTFRTFLPFGVKERENALCPNCLSLERHRLQWLYLKNETDFFSAPYKVLHVAPEQCFLKRFKALENLDYTTADLESPLADLHFDLHDIPLEDNLYDFFICNHVLEHVEDDKKVLHEVLRILKPEGKALMQVPLDYERETTYEDTTITKPSDREKHFGQKDHLRVYGLDYPDRLRKQGFDVEEIDYSEMMGKEKLSRYRLDPRELLYLCSKQKS